MIKIIIPIFFVFLLSSCEQGKLLSTIDPFPGIKFDKVKLISVSPSIYDSDVNFYQDNNLMFPTENGLYFIDSNHNPINNNYIEKILDSADLNDLDSILQPIPKMDIAYAKTCLPIFRDAIIFYSKEKPVAHIDICFTCYEVEFHPTTDYMTYFDALGRVQKLRDLFAHNGIKVSEPPPEPELPPPPPAKDSSHTQ